MEENFQDIKLQNGMMCLRGIYSHLHGPYVEIKYLKYFKDYIGNYNRYMTYFYLFFIFFICSDTPKTG